MPYGQKTISRKCYKGSILFSVLLLFLLCTFLLMAALESYRLSMDLNIRIKNYYIAKIMKQMALSEQSTLAEKFGRSFLLHNWICNISVGTTVPILGGGSLTVYLSVHRRSKK